jgi:hypothetical protein
VFGGRAEHFFAAYRNAHSQGGTNTRQRNMHHLFKWLALRYDHPDPWTEDMVRYGPVKSRPSTLAESFIRDLLEVTGGGKATSFVDARDHAMIRMLTEGVRREELAQQQITDLSEDLIARPFVRVVPFKDGREPDEAVERDGPVSRGAGLVEAHDVHPGHALDRRKLLPSTRRRARVTAATPNATLVSSTRPCGTMPTSVVSLNDFAPDKPSPAATHRFRRNELGAGRPEPGWRALSRQYSEPLATGPRDLGPHRRRAGYRSSS